MKPNKAHIICILSLILQLLSSALCLAEEPQKSETRYYRHEVNADIGAIVVRSNWSNDYEKRVMNKFGLVILRGGSNGLVYECWDKSQLEGGSIKAINYYYHFNHRLAVGGLFGGCKLSETLGYPYDTEMDLPLKPSYTDIHGISLFLLPSVKWSWMNCRWCSLYSKVSGGFHYQCLYLDSKNISTDYKDWHLSFSYVVTPIGWEIGRRKIRYYEEFGIGSNSYICLGIVFRFGRY